jgi:hypothetical protein
MQGERGFEAFFKGRRHHRNGKAVFVTIDKQISGIEFLKPGRRHAGSHFHEFLLRQAGRETSPEIFGGRRAREALKIEPFRFPSSERAHGRGKGELALREAQNFVVAIILPKSDIDFRIRYSAAKSFIREPKFATRPAFAVHENFDDILRIGDRVEFVFDAGVTRG